MFNRGTHSATIRMSEHDNEFDSKAFDSKFNTANLRGRSNIPRHTNDEKVAKPLIKDKFSGRTRIRASQDNRKRFLRKCLFSTTRMADQYIQTDDMLNKSLISFTKTLQCFGCRK